MAKYNKPLKKTERLHMLISPEEMAAIDEWQEKNGIAGRSDAMRRLAALGLAVDLKAEKLSELRAQTWKTFDEGTDSMLTAFVRGDEKALAETSSELVRALAGPLRSLTHELNALLEQAALFRRSGEFRDQIAAAQQVETAAAEQLNRFFKAIEQASPRTR